MTDIYDLHKTAFKSVSAYVILKDGERLATIAFKFPKDGAGRLWCYFHLIGQPMVRAYAGGYGYDKRSAAASNAIDALKLDTKDSYVTQEARATYQTEIDALKALLTPQMDSDDWNNVLRKAGYQVLQAV